LAIGIHEIGSLSACRMERLVNHGMSGLPAFLTLEGGLNSGFMIAHCTAAALGKYFNTNSMIDYYGFL
jgi:histidine ammonia-lyase